MILICNNPTKNSEGYADPTAYNGLRNIVREEEQQQKEVSQLIYLMKDLARICGYEVMGRIVVKDTKTGKVWR